MPSNSVAVNSTELYTTTIWKQFQKAEREGTPEGPMVSEGELKKIWKDAQKFYKELGVKDGRIPLTAVDVFEDEMGKLFNVSSSSSDRLVWMASKGAVKYFEETIKPELSESRIKADKTERELWGLE